MCSAGRRRNRRFRLGRPGEKRGERSRDGRGEHKGRGPRWPPGGGGWRLSVVLLLSVVCIGTAGYVTIEGWDVFDAFYMTITTVTTVGYGEIHPLSRARRGLNSGTR